jgi:hypothetical protein
MRAMARFFQFAIGIGRMEDDVSGAGEGAVREHGSGMPTTLRRSSDEGRLEMAFSKVIAANAVALPLTIGGARPIAPWARAPSATSFSWADLEVGADRGASAGAIPHPRPLQLECLGQDRRVTIHGCCQHLLLADSKIFCVPHSKLNPI